MSHQVFIPEITRILTNEQEKVLASSPNGDKKLLLIVTLNMWNVAHGKFRVLKKGEVKIQPPSDEQVYQHEMDTPTGPVHYWDFHFLHDAINRYNSLE